MESGAAFFILVGAFLLIGIPVLAIAAFVRAGDLRRQVQAETPQLIARIYALERQVAQIEKALATLSGSAVASPATPTASTPSPAAAVTNETPAPASPESYRRWKSLERHLHRPCHPRRQCKRPRPFAKLRRSRCPPQAPAVRVRAIVGISKRWSQGAG